jgi:hypothetical protein
MKQKREGKSQKSSRGSDELFWGREGGTNQVKPVSS